MDKAIDYYMGLPYTIEMVPGLESGWVVGVRELPGCISQGDSPQHAIDMIHEAMQGWLEIALEDGIPVPEPRPPETFSGKFVVRVPRSLHRALAQTADCEGVSLNQYVSTVLARAVGEHAGSPAAQQQQVAQRRQSVRKPGPKPDLAPANSPYIISRQAGAVCLADGESLQPSADAKRAD